MSKKQEHSDFLSPELIQKYREGKLSPQEMHRVERLLLENPFYAEAMEGLDKLEKDTSLDTHVGDLKERLHQRVGGHQKTIPMYRRAWPIAAAVALLLMGSWVTYYFYFITPEEQTAPRLSMQNEPPAASEPAPAPLQEESKAEERDQTADETKPAENTASSGIQESEAPPHDPIEHFDEDEVAEERETNPVLADAETVSPLATQQPDADAEEMATVQQPALAISKVPEENYDQAARSSRMLKSKDAGAEAYGRENDLFTLKGTVISGEDQSALPGVNVLLKNTSTGTVTDASGQFQIAVPGDQNEVVFNYIGFESREQTVSESDSNVTVVLNPDVTTLSEIVVVGYGTQEKKSIAGISQSKPSVGYSSYKTYLKENLQYPQAARENNMEGVVNVSFEVNPDGTLQNFAVEKSLGYGCDEEAIRLIKEGPAWQPAALEGNAISQNVTVKVRFSLKD